MQAMQKFTTDFFSASYNATAVFSANTLKTAVVILNLNYLFLVCLLPAALLPACFDYCLVVLPAW